jgi:glycosyltransferase involved in cell wall biosynthesis
MAHVSAFVCDYDRKLALRWKLISPSSPAVVIYAGIDISELPEPSPSVAGKIAFFGNYIHQKHPELFVEMADTLRDLDLSYVMIGGGDLEPVLRELIDRYNLSSRFTLTGQLPRAEALGVFNGSNVLVYPSRWDGLPVVLLEAAALKVPVISSDVSGIPEFISHMESGILVRNRCAAAYGQAVRQLLEDGELQRKIVENAYSKVTDSFNSAKCGEGHITLYDTLADEPVLS